MSKKNLISKMHKKVKVVDLQIKQDDFVKVASNINK